MTPHPKWSRISVLAILVAATLSKDLFSASVLNPDNGSYYDVVLVDTGIIWEEARMSAAGLRLMGIQGQLAVITSESENDFLIANFASLRPANSELWIGGSDAEEEGQWQWVTGSAPGTLFRSGGPDGTEILFADWAPGEPNNNHPGGEPSGEDFLGWSERGWNDLPGDFQKAGFIVEFVPEPSFLLFDVGLITVCCSIVMRKRAQGFGRQFV